MEEKTMNHLNFCYWLQGYFELTPKNGLNAQQIKIIKEHLNLTLIEKKPVSTDVTRIKLPAAIDLISPNTICERESYND